MKKAVHQFWDDLVKCLTEPRNFFLNRFPEVSLTYAITFAIIVSWFADLFNWLTRFIRHETLLDGFLRMRDQLSELPYWKNLPSSIWAQQPDHAFMPAWVAEALSVTLSPFQTLIRLVLGGLTLWIGIYLLVPKDEAYGKEKPELKNAIRIAAFASAPQLIGSILGFLPIGMGAFIAGVYGFVLLTYAISLRFQISGLRAIGVLILPGFLMSMIAGCLLIGFGAAVFGLFTFLFSH